MGPTDALQGNPTVRVMSLMAALNHTTHRFLHRDPHDAGAHLSVVSCQGARHTVPRGAPNGAYGYSSHLRCSSEPLPGGQQGQHTAQPLEEHHLLHADVGTLVPPPPPHRTTEVHAGAQ